MPSLTKIDFINEIQQLKYESRINGSVSIDILAGDLHRSMGDYPGPNHRMPSCCDAMYECMETSKGDMIVEKPDKGRGAKLKIRYYL